jgi:hypothetical protein
MEIEKRILMFEQALALMQTAPLLRSSNAINARYNLGKRSIPELRRCQMFI